MCRENTQKPRIPHCRHRWKDATKPNHFISPNSPSYCRMSLRRWVLRCHTTNWESQQGLLFGLLRRLCTATVITTIIWLPETSNGGVEAAGICIAPFDLGDLNKASARSAKGVKVATSCPSSLVCLSFPLLSEPPLLSSLFWLQKQRSNKNHALKTNITWVDQGPCLSITHKRRQTWFWQHTCNSLIIYIAPESEPWVRMSAWIRAHQTIGGLNVRAPDFSAFKSLKMSKSLSHILYSCVLASS